MFIQQNSVRSNKFGFRMHTQLHNDRINRNNAQMYEKIIQLHVIVQLPDIEQKKKQNYLR